MDPMGMQFLFNACGKVLDAGTVLDLKKQLCQEA